jgi:hypothetical protein
MSGLATLVLLAASCRAAEPAGATLAGTVRAKPRVESSDDMAGYGSGAPVRAKLFDYHNLRNVVVFAVPVGSSPSASTPSVVELDAAPGPQGPRLEPPFLAAGPGAELSIVNKSSGPVHVYAGGGSPSSVAVALGPGERTTMHVSSGGLYGFRCLESREASAGLFVAGGPFTRAADDGSYRIELQPGEYDVTAWHERLPPSTVRVRVEAGRRTKLDFTLTVRGLPEVR